MKPQAEFVQRVYAGHNKRFLVKKRHTTSVTFSTSRKKLSNESIHHWASSLIEKQKVVWNTVYKYKIPPSQTQKINTECKKTANFQMLNIVRTCIPLSFGRFFFPVRSSFGVKFQR